MADRTSGRTEKIWRDGQLVSWDDATIHVMSHVVHYGSSVFEGVRCYKTPDGGALVYVRALLVRAAVPDGPLHPFEQRPGLSGGGLVVDPAGDAAHAQWVGVSGA